RPLRVRWQPCPCRCPALLRRRGTHYRSSPTRTTRRRHVIVDVRDAAEVRVMDSDLLRPPGRGAPLPAAGLGSGRGCALLLARAGAHVVVADRELASSERTAAEIRTLGRTAQALGSDVRRAADVDAAVVAAVDGLGGLDVCVHNVGGLAGQPVRDFLDTPVDAFDAIAE